MHRLGWILGVLICVTILGFSASLASITGPKLYKMGQVKGWIPGARVHAFRVTAKLKSTDHDDQCPETCYWIGWTQADIRRPGPHRDNLPYTEWSRLKVGDTIEVITVGNDPSTYTRNDVFVEPGNFVFDLILFDLELCGAVLPVIALLALRRTAERR